LYYDIGIYGYLLKYRGRTIGGHGLSVCGRAEFKAMAEFEIACLVAGEFGDYEPAIRQIKRMVQ
jgi:hypothetical protein